MSPTMQVSYLPGTLLNKFKQLVLLAFVQGLDRDPKKELTRDSLSKKCWTLMDVRLRSMCENVLRVVFKFLPFCTGTAFYILK